MRREDVGPVAWLMAASALMGAAVYFASPAKADTSVAVDTYAVVSAPAICEVLNEYPTTIGLLGVGSAIEEQGGFTATEAGEVIGIAVANMCPRHAPLLHSFTARYAGEVAA